MERKALEFMALVLSLGNASSVLLNTVCLFLFVRFRDFFLLLSKPLTSHYYDQLYTPPRNSPSFLRKAKTFLPVILVLLSCEKELEVTTTTSKQSEISQETENSPAIDFFSQGTKLENPYTVENMKTALSNIRKKSSSFLQGKKVGEAIKTTHYYVRFLPENDFEKARLQEDDGLTLFDMPLDYEFPGGDGPVFHDANIPTDKISWQYTVVPVDYDLKKTDHEILAELFLDQDPEDETAKVKNGLTLKEWQTLEDEALRITGNGYGNTEKGDGLSARRKWYPDGTINYEDNTTNPSRTLPLQGVQVVVKRWFKWSTKFTDARGYFRARKFRSKKVKVAIKWERADWDIRVGSYGQAWYNFVELRRGNNWNLTIRRAWTPSNWHWASIHRGAMEYFYNNGRYGIRRPYKKSIFEKRLHIAGKYKDNRWFPDHYWTWNNIIWSAPVGVYSHDGNGNARDSRQIFATTIHELAHVSHWEIGYSTTQYIIEALNDDPFLPESWAVGVEHAITNRVYPETIVGANLFPHEGNLQWQTLRIIQTESKGYTPIVIDMMDDFNQGVTDTTFPNDRVSGYTLGQLENALPKAGSWWEWRKRIRDKYTNSTEGAELDYLFREYR